MAHTPCLPAQVFLAVSLPYVLIPLILPIRMCEPVQVIRSF
jgi:hypothetical protein